MVDKTTEGVQVEPEEVEAVLHNLCGYHLSERDALHRYTVLTQEQVLYDALVAAIRRERGRALAELVSSGHSMTHVAAMTNLRTRQRVQRLIAIAKAADEAVAKVQAASREFEERLAAVEATLDEVHNGPHSGTHNKTSPPAQPVSAPVEAPSVAPARSADADAATAVTTTIPVIPGTSAEPTADFDATAGFDVQHEQDSGYDPVSWLDTGRERPSADWDESTAYGAQLDGAALDGARPNGVLEPTRALPALAAARHPDRESRGEEPRWWRRNRGSNDT